MTLPQIFKNKPAEAAVTTPVEGRLDSAKPGARVVVLEFDRIAANQKAHLRAYGLAPGREIRVLQQHPVTVVQVEHTELAFEKDIAGQILVKEAA
ncbi:MAG TPA: ferrous iron transport protein A [Levilinea sp.]|nr:ferrous iron transport protein A [Levilinea sp.]